MQIPQPTANQLPEPLLIPKPWPYNKNWIKKVLEKDNDWNALDDTCGMEGAGRKISDYFSYTTPRALEKIAIQNTLITQINNNKIQPAKMGRSDVDWQSGNTWAKIAQETEILLNVYNAESAPPDVLEGILFTKSTFEQGTWHAEEIIKYIEHCVADNDKRQDDEFKRAQEERTAQMQARLNAKVAATEKWDAIDVEHSKIESGFVYALKNDLMPGVFKVGFTAQNPDKRANQLTQKYGLPSPFLVIEFWRTKDPYIVEQRIHELLSTKKKSGEFFAIEFNELKKVISSCLIN